LPLGGKNQEKNRLLLKGNPMTLLELKKILSENSGKAVVFALPDGSKIPSHYHVTEAGYVRKASVDCGGTARLRETCVLQLWVAADREHRLTGRKLAGILEAAAPVIPSESLPVEVEYNLPVLSVFSIAAVRTSEGGVVFQLEGNLADCLAKEQCGTGSPADDKAACCGTGQNQACCS
jgi:hypothetical protein